jgi:hypothetical protein
MSLIDALLLEPYPLNVWIAYRTDGIKGSGTMSDPYDGSPKLAAAGTANAYGSPLLYEIWQIGQMLVENKVFELVPVAGGEAVYGLNLGGGPPNLPYIFKDVVFRENLIHPFGEAIEESYAPYAVRINRVRRGLIEENVIDFPDADQVTHKLSDTVKYFDNQASDGQLLRGMDYGTGGSQDDLATLIEDSLTMALL